MVQQVVGDDRMDRGRHAREAAPRRLFVEHRLVAEVAAAAAVRFGNVGAQEAELAGASPDRMADVTAPSRRFVVRQHLGLEEARQRIAVALQILSSRRVKVSGIGSWQVRPPILHGPMACASGERAERVISSTARPRRAASRVARGCRRNSCSGGRRSDSWPCRRRPGRRSRLARGSKKRVKTGVTSAVDRDDRSTSLVKPISPDRHPSATASARVAALTFARICATWYFAVWAEMPSTPAMSRFDNLTTRSKTSSSRGVSGSTPVRGLHGARAPKPLEHAPPLRAARAGCRGGGAGAARSAHDNSVRAAPQQSAPSSTAPIRTSQPSTPRSAAATPSASSGEVPTTTIRAMASTGAIRRTSWAAGSRRSRAPGAARRER